MTDLALIDSGGANIASLNFAFKRLGVAATLTTDATVIRNAKRVVLPGVGTARDAMVRLQQAELIDTIRNLQQPVLGVCLGMQLLFDGSEEDDVTCLGIIPGVAKRLKPAKSLPVPNMGWCKTSIKGPHPLLKNIPDDSYFYYLHSYALPLASETLASASHSAEFSAVVAHENFLATQFHPERSSAMGAQLLRNFLEISV